MTWNMQFNWNEYYIHSVPAHLKPTLLLTTRPWHVMRELYIIKVNCWIATVHNHDLVDLWRDKWQAFSQVVVVISQREGSPTNSLTLTLRESEIIQQSRFGTETEQLAKEFFLRVQFKHPVEKTLWETQTLYKTSCESKLRGLHSNRAVKDTRRKKNHPLPTQSPVGNRKREWKQGVVANCWLTS